MVGAISGSPLAPGFDYSQLNNIFSMANQHVTLSKTEIDFLKGIWTQIKNGADNELDFWSYAAGFLKGAHQSWEDLALQEVLTSLEGHVEFWLDEYYDNLDGTLVPEPI